jgi:hypothetical protein
LAACFVLPISDDMGRKSSGIFQTLRDAALIQQTGGGNGFSFSHLRPKGTLVKTSAGQATGPVGFLRVYDHAFGEVAQGGTRRGANMAVLRVDHPDVEEFITCKTDENQITNFNISVGITDAFMQAVESDGGWDLKFPDVHDPRYRNFDGTLEQARDAGIPLKVYKRVRARELFEKIVKQSHHNGEPGLLFLDAANRGNPVPHLYQLGCPAAFGDALGRDPGKLFSPSVPPDDAHRRVNQHHAIVRVVEDLGLEIGRHLHGVSVRGCPIVAAERVGRLRRKILKPLRGQLPVQLRLIAHRQVGKLLDKLEVELYSRTANQLGEGLFS